MSVAAQINTSLDAAIAEAEQRYIARNPKSQAHYERALAGLPGGNTRTVLHYPPFPLTLAKGEGCHVTDIDAHRYVDFVGEFTAGLYGHSDPRIMAALHQALDGGIVMGGIGANEAKLADDIVARFPAIERVRFTNSGTEANLMAISTARAVTGRDKVMVMDGGYHGGVFYFAAPEMPINAPFAYVHGRYNDVEGCRALILEHAADLACVILEPMLGGAGCIPASPEFLAMLRAETDAAGALLIFDEVMTSRLSPGGLQQAHDVLPDLTSLGKYIGGGMSFGAFGGRADLIDLYDPRRPDAIPHAGTFNNNVMTMAAGHVGLSQVFTPAVAEDFNRRGESLRARLNGLAEARALPVCFTGLGAMMAIHFTARPPRNFDDVLAGRNELRPLLHLDLMERGIYAPRRGMFNLSLPMDDGAFDRLCEAIDEFFSVRAPLLA